MKLKRLGIAFSLSHLLLGFFFMLSTGNGYLFPTKECSFQIGSFLILLTFTTCILYWAIQRSNNLLYIFYVFAAYVIARGCKGMIHFSFGYNYSSLLFLFGLTLFFLSFLFFYQRYQKKCILLTQYIFLFFVPFGLFTVFKLSKSFLELQKDIPLKPYQVCAKNTPKIYWIIFDELDQYLLFEKNSPHKFKEFERLKNTSIYANKAQQAGSCTNITLPAFTIGLEIKDVLLNSPFSLQLLSTNGKKYDWKNAPNIFQKAYSLGYNCSLIGWYHPYDRILGSDVSYLSLEPFSLEKGEKKRTSANFGLILVNQIAAFFHYNFSKLFQLIVKKPLFDSQWIKTLETTRCETWYHCLLEQMNLAMKEDRLQFHFFHLPIPHYPTCFDPKTQKIALKEPNYFDNVFLADKTLGWIRENLTKLGQWDNSVIIVTSDHWLRVEKGFVDQYIKQESPQFQALLTKRAAPYVPFLIKMPHQNKMLKITEEFNSLILHDLVLEIMKGTVQTEKDVETLIREKAKIVFLDKSNPKVFLHPAIFPFLQEKFPRPFL